MSGIRLYFRTGGLLPDALLRCATCCRMSRAMAQCIRSLRCEYSAVKHGKTLLLHSFLRLTTERGESSPQKSEQESAAAGRKRRRKGGDANKKNDHEGYGGTGQGWGVDGALHHVNLFDDAEREAGKRLGQNAEHQKERRDQELLEQKRSGLAPTALGEGSAELKGAHEQPWYSLVSPAAGSARPEVAAGVRAVKLGREVIGEEAEEVLKRDEGRKYRADPMGSFFRHAVDTGAHDGGTTNSSTTTFGAGGRAKASSSSGGSKKLAVADDVDGKAAGSGGEKRVKKHKKEKKHKKKSKSGRKEKHRRRDDRTRSDSPEGSDVAGDEEVAARQRAVVRLATSLPITPRAAVPYSFRRRTVSSKLAYAASPTTCDAADLSFCIRIFPVHALLFSSLRMSTIVPVNDESL